MDNTENRRPLKTRGAGWAKALAKGLGNAGLSPNAISTIGVLFAAAGAWAFLQAPDNIWLWLVGALFVQLRLLADMLGRLAAADGAKKSATGPLFSELANRVEDALLLIAVGHATLYPELGYGATILAVLAAWIRATGSALGFAQDFVGPMARQHRMFFLTLACVITVVLGDDFAMRWALLLIVVGTAITCVIRTWRIARLLRKANTA